MKFFDSIGKLFQSKKSVDDCVKEIEKLSKEVELLKLELAKLRPKKQEHKRFEKKQPELVFDLHGNAIQPQVGATGRSPLLSTDRDRPTRNLRMCKVWGCKGRNERNGYCMLHYRKNQKPDEETTSPTE